VAKKKTTKRPPSQASLEALVRYRPQFDALTQLSRDALSTRDSSISAANTVASSVRAALEGARQPLADVYDQAGQKAAGIQSGVQADLAGLKGPAADAIRAAAIAEAAGAAGQLTTAATRGQQGITDQIGRVGAGQQQAVLAAGGKYAEDVAKIGQQRSSLADQLGDFEALTQSKLDQDERDKLFDADQKAADRRVSLMKSGINPETGVFDPSLAKPSTSKTGTGTLPGGKKLATPEQHGSARDSILGAVAAIKAQRDADPSVSRSELAKEFLAGAPAATVKRSLTKAEIKSKVNEATGEPLTLAELRNGIVSEKVPAISKVDADYLSAALDLVFDNGRISHGQPGRTTAEKLHARGLSVKGLGFALTDHTKRKPKAKAKPKKRGVGVFATPIGG
jgi:hypothetical protein